MTSLNPLTTFAVAVVLAFVANVSGAAPLSHGNDAMVRGTATLSLAELVNGTHRA